MRLIFPRFSIVRNLLIVVLSIYILIFIATTTVFDYKHLFEKLKIKFVTTAQAIKHPTLINVKQQKDYKFVIWNPLYKKPIININYKPEVLIPENKNLLHKICPGTKPCIAFGSGYFKGNSWKYQIELFHSKSKCLAQCDLVGDIRQADAVIFHGVNLTRHIPWKHRHPDQIWMFLGIEPPTWWDVYGFQNIRYLYRHMFNWTVSYLPKSDVYTPHGLLAKRQHAILWNQSPYKSIKYKKRLMYTFISNCLPFNNRQIKVQQLQQHMEIDGHGMCFENKITKEMSIYNKLSQQYFFYLSFENSFCSDYITEKFFHNGLSYDAVPVVIGGLSKKEYLRVAPPNSFIYANDFQTASQLASYLYYLAENPKEYAKYHQWKFDYEVVANFREEVVLCKTCDAIWKWKSKGASKKQADLEDIYNQNCLPKEFNSYLV